MPWIAGRRRARRRANWPPPARYRYGRECRRGPGDDLDHLADDLFDLVRQGAAVGVAEHDPARAFVIGGLGAGEREVADPPCSRRRSARSRAALRVSCARRRVRCRGSRRGFPPARLERDPHVIIPGFRHKADGVGFGLEQRREAGIVRGRAAGPAGHAEGGEGRAQSALLGEQLACRSGSRRDSRPRHSRCRVRPACARWRACRASVKSTPLVCAPSRKRGVEEIEAFAGHGLLRMAHHR